MTPISSLGLEPEQERVLLHMGIRTVEGLRCRATDQSAWNALVDHLAVDGHGLLRILDMARRLTPDFNPLLSPIEEPSRGANEPEPLN